MNVTAISPVRIKIRPYVISYILILIVHLYSGHFGHSLISQLSKPLLLISLSAFFFLATLTKPVKFRNLILSGLLFSLLGDILLIFEGAAFFMAGLGAFLIAHVFYTIAFFKNHQSEGNIRAVFLPMILAVAFSAYYFSLLKENLGDMLIPVVCYISIITIMLVSAIYRWDRVVKKSFWPILTGAALFVVSDSLLAWNKFMEPLEFSHLMVMSTYGLAQLLIALGAVYHLRSTAV